jgi:hypothetical protein
VHDGYVNLLVCDTHYTENTETSIDAIEWVGLEITAKDSKDMLLSLHQNERQDHGLKIAKIFLKMWHC